MIVRSARWNDESKKTNLTASIEEITSNGRLTIKFSEPIYKPCFMDSTNAESKRELEENE